MSNLKTSKLGLVTVAAGAVILLSVETTQAGGFSIRIGGLGFGSWNTRCVQRSYFSISDFGDDWGCNYVYRRYSRCRPRHRVRYDVRPYYGGRRFRTLPHRRGGRRHGGRHHHR